MMMFDPYHKWLGILPKDQPRFIGCDYTNVSDLSPVQGMPLIYFKCNNSPVLDLSPLQATKLYELQCEQTKVSDFSPLKGDAVDTTGFHACKY